MDMETVRPATTSGFYGQQRQPRKRSSVELPRRTPTMSRSPAFGDDFLSNGFNSMKRLHSPIRGHGMSTALKDVNRPDTPRPASTRTWEEARKQNLSVEKKLKSIKLNSGDARTSPRSASVFPARIGPLRTYSGRRSVPMRLGASPRELFADIENQDPSEGVSTRLPPLAEIRKQYTTSESDPEFRASTIMSQDGTSESQESVTAGEADDDQSGESLQQQSVSDQRPIRIKSTKSPIPLTNLKNSCYMNSVIQSLTAFPDFLTSLQRFLNGEAQKRSDLEKTTGSPTKSDETCASTFPITTALVKLFIDYEIERRRRDGEDKSVNIRYRLEKLKDKVGNQSKQFLSDNQQDAGEFFSFLMDAASDEIKKANPVSIIDEWLATTTQTQMKCRKCDHTSDPVLTHSTVFYVQVPEERQDDDQDLDLQRLVNSSLHEVDRREFPCPADDCKGQEVDATRIITKLPKILVILMSRISMTAEKIERPVDLNETIRISAAAGADELSSTAEYELRSVICHIGPSTTTGHYYSLTRNHVNNLWYDCDDRSIYSADFSQVCSDGRIRGYCFFYERIE